MRSWLRRSRAHRAALGLAAWLSACTAGKAPEREADAGAQPPQAPRPDGSVDGPLEDAGSEPPSDAASPVDGVDATLDAAQSIVCPCVHGTCNAERACECEEGYLGELCDTPSYLGTGRDGELVVRAPLDLSVHNHEGRACNDGGDAVAYSLVAFPDASSARVSPVPGEGCLAPGDEVLVINLQGTDASTENVGRHEFLEVESVSGDVVYFARAKREFYGAGADNDDDIGSARDQQRVVLQRVPHYRSVLVPAGQLVTAQAWDGTRGGVLAFRVQERLIAAGRIDMVSRGYVGGAETTSTGTSGAAGESVLGVGDRGRAANGGGGGGGAGDYDCDTFGFSGAGGGHATGGSDGTSWCSGFAGESYGDPARARLGSGGGAGGTDNTLSNNPPGASGGAGGGVILLSAREIYVYGAIDASGAAGLGDGPECPDVESASSCWDYSGPGGGGAGGYVSLEAMHMELGKRYARARGGLGGNGLDNYAGNGGAGGAGFVLLQSHGEAPTGQTDPEPTVTP